jgi:hypothetical protein
MRGLFLSLFFQIDIFDRFIQNYLACLNLWFRSDKAKKQSKNKQNINFSHGGKRKVRKN